MYSYKLERKLRRTLAIQIKPEGTIIVKAPLLLPQFEIDKFVNSKIDWISKVLKKLAKQTSEFTKADKHTYDEQDEFYYLGVKYPLRFSNEYSKKVYFSSGFIIPDIYQHNKKTIVKKLLLNWYKKQARDIFEQRLLIYSSKYELKFNEFRLTSAKTRWGSCTSTNNIRLNWKLLMAPLEVLDYVVIHELCHTVHHNHSKNFWNSVSDIEPNYKDRKAWLRKNGHNLKI